ncbi:hypothetical protein QQX98_012427 [Neonectria punicea]|uniref:C2H2-type domain-containing protein n=1 Tax=Neonectria punicea TaxID=979145 RepID=A0ABR1GIU3_9HYPO
MQYVDRTEEARVACPFCVSTFDDAEEFRGHMIDHSRNDFPKITEDVERISKLYDPYFPQKDEEITLIRQPDARPISYQQHKTESQKIFEEVETAEDKYRLHDKDNVDDIVILQRTMLHSYYDFLLVTQHPNAPESTREEASRLNIPTRVWDQGIHPALELLREKLPGSFEHMKCALPFSYSMLTLLQENFPEFQSVWMDYQRRLEEYCRTCGVAPGWAPVDKKQSHL